MEQKEFFIFPPIKIQLFLDSNFITKISLSLDNITSLFTYKIHSHTGELALEFFLQYFFKKTNPRITLPLKWDLISPFTRKVLSTLSKHTNFGEWISYQKLAELTGNKNGARAVGRALNKNPWPIVIPCHRVLKKDQKIGGFSSGIQIKKILLRHENILY
jgi:methylated-DNA-[protein]-cysteine S-methyltransferase